MSHPSSPEKFGSHQHWAWGLTHEQNISHKPHAQPNAREAANGDCAPSAVKRPTHLDYQCGQEHHQELMSVSVRACDRCFARSQGRHSCRTCADIPIMIDAYQYVRIRTVSPAARADIAAAARYDEHIATRTSAYECVRMNEAQPVIRARRHGHCSGTDTNTDSGETADHGGDAGFRIDGSVHRKS